MPIEFQRDKTVNYIYQPNPTELLTLGLTGDMQPIIVHARIPHPDRLKLFLCGFNLIEPDDASMEPNLRFLFGDEVNKFQKSLMGSLFLDYDLNNQIIKIFDNRFRWYASE